MSEGTKASPRFADRRDYGPARFSNLDSRRWEGEDLAVVLSFSFSRSIESRGLAIPPHAFKATNGTCELLRVPVRPVVITRD